MLVGILDLSVNPESGASF